ncbi:MAG: hypothetical protein HY812_11440 [Planctomycetes bacterium]|nr:hypothetical protein [Planctomycetota bacterium]
MKRPVLFVLGLAGSAVLLQAGASAADKPKIKPTVAFATSWDAALEEARLLNVPIVVHSHGFKCPPCWGMHASVLQNKDYIKFAEKSTVEVICLGRLQEGIDEKSPKAATYKSKVNGQEVERLVEWPNLTVEEILALGQSKAGAYNDTGFVPFTAVIDPHTEQEMARFPGSTAAGTLMEGVEQAREKLESEHGKGVARKELRGFEDAEAAALEGIAGGEYGAALDGLDKLAKASMNWPQPLQERLAKARAQVVDAAKKALEAIEKTAASDPVQAQRELAKLAPRLRGTGLEERAGELKDSL